MKVKCAQCGHGLRKVSSALPLLFFLNYEVDNYGYCPKCRVMYLVKYTLEAVTVPVKAE